MGVRGRAGVDVLRLGWFMPNEVNDVKKDVIEDSEIDLAYPSPRTPAEHSRPLFLHGRL